MNDCVKLCADPDHERVVGQPEPPVGDQIQQVKLTFVPKLIGVGLGRHAGGDWTLAS